MPNPIQLKLQCSLFYRIQRVLLFGSMAGEDFNTHNDYDLLIVTKNSINSMEKMKMETRISKSLVYLLHVPVDVLLYGQQDLELKKMQKALFLIML